MATELEEIAKIESRAKMEGRSMFMVLAPRETK
jgi:translation initiation factor IF-3